MNITYTAVKSNRETFVIHLDEVEIGEVVRTGQTEWYALPEKGATCAIADEQGGKRFTDKRLAALHLAKIYLLQSSFANVPTEPPRS